MKKLLISPDTGQIYLTSAKDFEASMGRRENFTEEVVKATFEHFVYNIKKENLDEYEIQYDNIPYLLKMEKICEYNPLICAKTAQKITSENYKNQLLNINEKIIEAAHKGMNYIIIYEEPKLETLNALEKAGYKVSSGLNAYNDMVATIRW